MSLPRKRSAVGNAAKRYKSQPDTTRKAALDDARRELAAAKLEEQISVVLAACPPLSEDQKIRLAALLRGGL